MNESTLQLDPFYYLHNFELAMQWLAQSYADLLNEEEHGFLTAFAALPQPSRALLVRLIMRKGNLFRRSRLNYPEIGDAQAALDPLTHLTWIDSSPLISLDNLFRLFNRGELANKFVTLRAAVTKRHALEILQTEAETPRPLREWLPGQAELILDVRIDKLCTRLRALYFGNFRQQWSEFVLVDLGIFKYEAVELTANSRAFQSRDQVDTFWRLLECREMLQLDAPPASILDLMPSVTCGAGWLTDRYNRLLYRIAQRFEKLGEPERGLDVYRMCTSGEARLRAARVLERLGKPTEALAIANDALSAPRDDTERHKMPRIARRLRRCLKLQNPAQLPLRPPQMSVSLHPTDPLICIERQVRDHLSDEAAPAFYVENTLLNALFGLLCWDAVFAPVPGAFFHPFHSAPADLTMPSFRTRRAEQFATCLDQLEVGTYRDNIRRTFISKNGIRSPFVFWGAITEELLELALSCIPPAHLRIVFERLLSGLHENCTGLPDLIQFWPHERRYRMIEVKGPGDRLQDNQRRWMDFCAQHGLPVTVCHVSWTHTHTSMMGN